MMTTKNTWRIILSAAVLGAFFLPWYNFTFATMSAWDIVVSKGTQDDQDATIFRYSVLIIPFLSLVILLLSVNKRSTPAILRILLFLFTGLLATIFFYAFKDKMDTTEIFKVLGAGLYISVIASLLLMFMGGRAVRKVVVTPLDMSGAQINPPVV